MSAPTTVLKTRQTIIDNESSFISSNCFSYITSSSSNIECRLFEQIAEFWLQNVVDRIGMNPLCDQSFQWDVFFD